MGRDRFSLRVQLYRGLRIRMHFPHREPLSQNPWDLHVRNFILFFCHGFSAGKKAFPFEGKENIPAGHLLIFRVPAICRRNMTLVWITTVLWPFQGFRSFRIVSSFFFIYLFWQSCVSAYSVRMKALFYCCVCVWNLIHQYCWLSWFYEKFERSKLWWKS